MTAPAKPTIDEQILQNQLAACQKECKEQARLNGMGSEREARLMAQLAELQAKHDALVKDAERYRWLRADWTGRKWGHCIFRDDAHDYDEVVGASGELDAAIDAAMSAVALDKGGE